jgi:glutamyl-tRNA reductase
VSVVVVGLEHRAVSLDVLGRVTVTDAELPDVLRSLRQGDNLQELVVLSTCLRTEIYAVVDRFHDAVFELQAFLAKRAESSIEDLESSFAVRFDDDVATHLFSVAAGLESAVLGETEILGQVRRAWEHSHREHASGPVLAGLFRQAVRAGKRARSETTISRGTTSFAYAAVELARNQLDGGLAGRTVVVVGAGDIGQGLVRALASQSDKPAELAIANRTASRSRAVAEEAAGSVLARAIRLEDVAAAVSSADVIFSALDVPHPVLGPNQLAREGGSGRPLLVVDLGMPPNVEPQVRELAGVNVLGMNELRDAVARATTERAGEAEAVAEIVSQETDRYQAAVRARGAAPVIAALRDRLEALRVSELERQRALAGDVSDAQWASIEESSRAVLAKLVHLPTVLLKETAGTARGERLVEALRALFEL